MSRPTGEERATQRPTLEGPRLSHMSGVYQTSPGLLRRRLVGPWGEGLAQYITLRIGDLERGRAAYRSLLRTLNALPPEELVVPPGPKARLYRLARTIADCEEDGGERDKLPWRNPGGNRGVAIERLRRELSDEEAELIELQHARELIPDEIACVLERPLEDVELALDAANARARKILGEHAPDPAEASASILVEAFALDESPRPDAASELHDDHDDELEAGTVIGGRYKLVERVGIGAFGDVYRADDTEVPGHRVALKLLRQPSMSETARQSALRELRLNAAVFHPSLVQFKDHGWWEQRLWFVMPWYEGETLESRMQREKLDRAEARKIFEALARALAALHEAGIRHQDIKPDNIFLTQLRGASDVLPILIDLGVAADEQEGLIGGTPLYFAPEVAARFAGAEEDEVDVGPAADVFALALTLRNALEPETEEDVPGGAIRAFVFRRAGGPPPLPTSRDLRFLDPAFTRWLNKDPKERPSAEKFAEELAILTAPEERRARRLRIARWLVPLLLVLGALFGASVYVLKNQAKAREKEAAFARSEAANAQAEAQNARADVAQLEERRRALEAGQAELQQRIEESALSRTEIAEQLASAEVQLGVLREELAQTVAARDTTREALAAERRTLAERDQELAALRTDLANLRAESERRIAALNASLEDVRAEVQRRDRTITELESRIRELGTEVQTERTARRAADDRAAELSAQLAAAIRGQRAAEDRAEELAAQLATAIRERRAAEDALERERQRAAPSDPAPPADAPSP
jgi:hypothetical protein